MRKISILMLFLITSVGYAIASVENSPVKINVSELARGNPTEIVAIVPLVIVPCEVYETRNVRDVDVSCIAILNNEETKVILKGNRKYRDVDSWCKSSNYKSKVAVNTSAVLARGNLGGRWSKNV
jgi:hypothetical protein